MGPIFGKDAAGFGPGVCSVELKVPLERPQLFGPDFSDRPIQEKAVYMLAVPVHAKGPHGHSRVDPAPTWRRENSYGATIRHCTVEKHGDVGPAPKQEKVWGFLMMVTKTTWIGVVWTAKESAVE